MGIGKENTHISSLTAGGVAASLAKLKGANAVPKANIEIKRVEEKSHFARFGM
jgi:hypothetical protein